MMSEDELVEHFSHGVAQTREAHLRDASVVHGALTRYDAGYFDGLR